MKVSWDDYSQYMEKNVTNHQPVYNYIHLLVKPLKYPRYPLDSYPQILLVQREKTSAHLQPS